MESGEIPRAAYDNIRAGGSMIKTAQAWARVTDRGIDIQLGITDIAELDGDSPVVIVHGLTESEVHEAAALLARSREVCEHRDTGIGTIRTSCEISYPTNQRHGQRPCWCGRKVKIV